MPSFRECCAAAALAVVLGPPLHAAPAASTSATSAQPARDLTTAAAGQLVVTNPAAAACQNAAQHGDTAGNGAAQCTEALATPLYSRHDLAATYTDRGAVYLQHGQYAQAQADFDSALQIDPAIADAYVNRGAARLAQQHYAEAIDDIDHGLALNPDQPERAWFNRAIAHERLGNLKGAYADYEKAAQLDPAWDAPKTEMAKIGPP